MPTEDPGLLIELARFAAMVETAIRSQQELATQWGPKHAMIKAAHRCAKPFNDIIDGMNNPGSPYWHGMLTGEGIPQLQEPRESVVSAKCMRVSSRVQE